MQFARRSTVLAIAILVAMPVARAEWTPPEKPDPTTILREAQADARARRYEDALAKHLWYHENAETIDAGQTGVRRSFALSSWYDLAADYAPALTKFEECRENARKGALEGKHPKHVWNNFADFASMSKQLDDDQAIADLFLEIRDESPKQAEKVYPLAEPALVTAERFDVCGEFLDAERAMEREIDSFKHNNKLADERFGKMHRSFGEKSFRHGAATIVVILAKNGKTDEAKKLAQQARDAWDDEKLHEALDQALEGTPPKAFP